MSSSSQLMCDVCCEECRNGNAGSDNIFIWKLHVLSKLWDTAIAYWPGVPWPAYMINHIITKHERGILAAPSISLNFPKQWGIFKKTRDDNLLLIRPCLCKNAILHVDVWIKTWHFWVLSKLRQHQYKFSIFTLVRPPQIRHVCIIISYYLLPNLWGECSMFMQGWDRVEHK